MNECPNLIRNNLRWYEAMVNTYHFRLSESEKKELAAWENEQPILEKAVTSDWPGWQRYIGLPPWKVAGNGMNAGNQPNG